MLKENFLFLIFIILIFYVLIMPLINNYYIKKNKETFESILGNPPTLPSMTPTSLVTMTPTSLGPMTTMITSPMTTSPSKPTMTTTTVAATKPTITSNYVNSMDSNNNYLSLNNPGSNLELPDDMKIDLQKCSMNCCSLNQWTPFMDPNYGPVTQELNYDYGIWARDLPTDFVPNNYSCDNGDKGRGCVCLSKKLMDIYANRGGN